MIKLFLVSFLAGFILSAPFGPAGALVADAALVHDRKRLIATILAAVLGNGFLAFFISLWTFSIEEFFRRHASLFYLVVGAVITILGFMLAVITAFMQKENKRDIFTSNRVLKLGITSPSVFLITILHPGSIAAFLVLISFFYVKFPIFQEQRLVFTLGIILGSSFAFIPLGIVFWIVKNKIGKFIVYFRYGFAVLLVIIGMYLFLMSFLNYFQ